MERDLTGTAVHNKISVTTLNIWGGQGREDPELATSICERCNKREGVHHHNTIGKSFVEKLSKQENPLLLCRLHFVKNIYST